MHTARAPAPHNHSHHYQCRTPYAAVHTVVLLMMGIMMPETCWDKFDNKYQISCIWLVSLSSPYVHDARSQEPEITKLGVDLRNFADERQKRNINTQWFLEAHLKLSNGWRVNELVSAIYTKLRCKTFHCSLNLQPNHTSVNRLKHGHSRHYERILSVNRVSVTIYMSRTFFATMLILI